MLFMASQTDCRKRLAYVVVHPFFLSLFFFFFSCTCCLRRHKQTAGHKVATLAAVISQLSNVDFYLHVIICVSTKWTINRVKSCCKLQGCQRSETILSCLLRACCPLSTNTKLSVSWQCLEAYGVTQNDSGWRKNDGNRDLEFETAVRFLYSHSHR